MTDYIGRTYEGEQIELDGNTYTDCRFDNCVLIFKGGDLPSLKDNVFSECGWQFDGAAARTLAFMTAMYHGGGRELIEQTFENVRQGQ